MKFWKELFTRKETFFNLQADWDGELEWAGVLDHSEKRIIKNLVAFEVDVFRKQSWWRRLLNLMPPVRFFNDKV